MSTGIRKEAVDSVAEEYWQSYYSESGYGALWTRSIPKRVKAELDKQQPALKQASAQASKSPSIPEIRPIATVIGEDGVSLEGVAIYAEPRTVCAFVVEFDHEGVVKSFDVLNGVK